MSEVDDTYAVKSRPPNLNYSRATDSSYGRDSTLTENQVSQIDIDADIVLRQTTLFDIPKSLNDIRIREEDFNNQQGCCKRTTMFTKYALQDIRRNKCHYMLAFGSVFVVVFSILVVNTIV
jgi:hypothetical protein